MYIYIYFFPQFFSQNARRIAVAARAHGEKGCSAQDREGRVRARDNWPIIVDRDDTRVLSQNYSRTVARGRIQFGAASTLGG